MHKHTPSYFFIVTFLVISALGVCSTQAAAAKSSTRDRTPPSLDIEYPSSTKSKSVRIYGSVSKDTDSLMVNGERISIKKNGNFKIRNVPLPEKENVFKFKAKDKAGNTTKKKIKIISYWDSTPPVILITGVEQGGVYAPGVKPDIQISDTQSPVTEKIRLDRELFVSGTAITAEGEHTLKVKAVDSYENSTKRSVTFTIVPPKPPDPPVPPVNRPPVLDFISNLTVYDGETVTLKPSASDPDGDVLVFTYSGWMTSSGHTVTRSDSGSHTVTVSVFDGENTDSQDVTVTVEACGDSVLNGNEICDDGAQNGSPNHCNAQCAGTTTAVCDNGVKEAGEGCDDGNKTSGDGCSSSCVIEICGDGIVQTALGETCEGNSIKSCVSGGYNGVQSCAANCIYEACSLTEFCGDGTVQTTAGEACDDGNKISGDGCSGACKLEGCGDGIVQAGLGEQCDDGNKIVGDGCSASCKDEYCGDEIIQTSSGEVCDLNSRSCNTASGYPGSQDCNVQCAAFGACTSALFCGDGICTNPAETTVSCFSDCPSVCGNGFAEPSEECDDGNKASGDGCSSACKIEFCGDGVAQASQGEECDDGNKTSGDGCGKSCLREQLADTTAPSIPAGLTATVVSSSQANLSWTASTDNVGVTGYKIFRNNVETGTATTTNYSDMGLSPNINYSFTVSAYDAAGNESAESTSASATTQSALSSSGSALYVDNAVAVTGTGSIGSPLKTIQEALNKAAAGTVIIIRGDASGAGRIYSETPVFPASGMAIAPITIKSFSGEKVVISHSSTIAFNKNYLIWDGLIFDHQNVAGDAVTWSGSNNVVRNSEIRNGQRDGIDFAPAAANNLIENSIIHDFKWITTIRNDAHCIVTDPPMSNLTIRNNTIYDCSGDGIQLFAGTTLAEATSSSAIVIEGNTIYSTLGPNMENALDFKDGINMTVKNNTMYGFTNNKTVVFQKYHNNVLFEGNIIRDGGGVEFRGEPVGTRQNNITIVRNVIYATAGRILYGFKLDGVDNINIYNNTIVNASGNSFLVDGAGVNGGALKNNLVYNSGTAAKGSSLFSAGFSNNGWFNAGAGFLSGTNDTIGTDPVFINAAVNNYRLASNSPAIDRGVNVGYLYSGTAPDLGAYESSSSTSDTTAPSVPMGLTATAISATQINLSWAAATDNVGVTGYKIFRNGTEVGTSTTTIYQATGLTASTSYSFTVSAYDAAGNNSAQSAVAGATTQSAAASDTIAPSVPTALMATAVSSSQINLVWGASTDNVGVTGYRIFRNNIQAATAMTASYSNTGLSPNINYSFTVSAYDAAGNESAESTSASATTQALPDTTASGAPVILYTDILSGPNAGGENNNGAYLSIFGKGFGTTRGTSTVKINGVEVAAYKQWGAPSKVFDSHGIQVITVQPGVNVTSGSIIVTIGGTSSNSDHIFNVHAGDIYFVDGQTGNNSTGVANDITKPYLGVQYVSDLAAFGAGDTIVIRGGTYSVSGQGANFLRWDPLSGTADSPMAVIGYPGETINIKKGSTGECRFSYYNGGGSYSTTANLNLDCNPNSTAFLSNAYVGNVRIVNNDFKGMHGSSGGSGLVTGAWHHTKILGNAVHEIGDTKLYHGIYLSCTDTSLAEDIEVGWNHVYDAFYGAACGVGSEDCSGRLIQIYNGLGPGFSDVSIHDNVLHDGSRHAISLGYTATGVKVYNNIIYRTGLGVDQESGIRINHSGVVGAEWYNNVGYDNANGLFAFDSGSSVTVRNNINVVLPGQIYESGAMNRNNITDSHNLFYGAGSPPSWADPATSVNADPLFVDPASPARNFHLQVGSPAIDSGVLTSFSRDFDGKIRPIGTAFDIGAFEDQ